jgi:uncharacterized protein (DUF433 family)
MEELRRESQLKGTSPVIPEDIVFHELRRTDHAGSRKRGAKPCIRGLRITVYDLLEYLASGMSQEEILNHFPDLEAEDIRACLNFAADRERKLFAPA